jgi:pilus assembly protein CpaE
VSPSPQEEQARGEEGSASIELVGVLPFLLLAILVAAQLAIAGQALWSAAVAARAGARADLVGAGPRAAAREALPPALRAGSRVGGGGSVSVEVQVPRLLPVVPAFRVGAETRLGPGRG